jgi:TonB family protein
VKSDSEQIESKVLQRAVEGLKWSRFTKSIEIQICALSVALLASADAAQPLLVDQKLMAAGKIDIRPEYPAKAQAEHLTGAGVFVLHVHQGTGRVISVEIQKSTGHAILDDATVAKFSNLRFKPQTVSTLKIPVEFTLPNRTESTSRLHNLPAVAQFRSDVPFPVGRRGAGKM